MIVERPHIQLRSFVLGGNHGQYLQAAGLARVVRDLCPDARVTHASYENHRSHELRIQARSLQLPKYLAMRRHWARRIAFSAPHAAADVTIYGADQIWSHSNPLFPPDPYFFGEGDTARKIAYAPSMGHVPPEFRFPERVKIAISRFDSVAVRDKASQRAVTASGLPEPPIVVDPAFFLMQDMSAASRGARSDRIAVYCPQSRLSVPSLLKAGKARLAGWPIERHGYLPRRNAWRLDTQLRMPEAVLSQIARSRFLLTSTFHGVVMALMTGTPFVALRSDSLLDRLDAPAGRGMFGAHRLVTRPELEALDASALDALLSTDDIDGNGIAWLVDQSRDWFKIAIRTALAQTGSGTL